MSLINNTKEKITNETANCKEWTEKEIK